MGTPEPVVVHMIGNAHLDPVWLWHWQRGADEALATCRSACDLLDDYPDATFTRGESWVYEQVRQLDGALFRRVRAHVEAGRWEVAGGWHIQADTNLPTEEALARSIEIGHAWFRRYLGLSSVPVAYLVDSFGHGAYLPRILRHAGQEFFVFTRPGASEMELPGSPFRWQSPDGAEVLAARPPSYLDAGLDLSDGVRSAIQAALPGVGHALCFYGVGDHGGGPTRAAVEWILAHRDSAPGVRLEFSSLRRYFEAVSSRREELPVVVGELGPHAVGCYSVCGHLKRDIRAAEQAAADAQDLLRTIGGPESDCADLEAAWESICFNQFHDVVTGSAIRDAIDAAGREVAGAHSRIERLFHKLLRRHPHLSAARDITGHRLHAANRSPRAWDGLAAGELWFDWQAWDHHLEDAAGNVVPSQLAPPESVVEEAGLGTGPILRLLWPVQLRPHEIKSFRIVPRAAEPSLPGPRPRFEAGVLDNGCVRVALNDRGIEQIQDLRSGARNLLAAPLELVVLQDHTDTWGHGVDRFEGAEVDRARFEPPELIESGPLRTTVRMMGRLANSRLALLACLLRDQSVLHLTLAVNYAEPLSVLKASLPLATPVSVMKHRVAGGWIERPADGREYPLHHALLAEGDAGPIGLALPDSFAISAEAQLLQPTLIRNNINGVHISKGIASSDAASLCHKFGTDEGPQTIRLSVAVGQTPLEALLDCLQRPPIVWDDYHGVSRLARLEPE